MMKSILLKTFLGGAVLQLSAFAFAADLYQAQSYAREAIREAEGIYNSGGFGEFYVAENNLRELPYLINDLPMTPALSQINRLCDSAVRSLRGYGSQWDKARVVINNGREVLRLIDILIRDNDHFPGRGDISDTLVMVDRAERMVFDRNYQVAIQQIREIDEVLSRYVLDIYLRSARDALVDAARTLGDPYSGDLAKQRVGRDQLRVARDGILNSDAYRREGGYYPPVPPPHPPGPPGRLVRQRFVCESSGEYRECFVGSQIVEARIISQRGPAPCFESRTWGFAGQSLWVDRACRAEFELLLETRF
jgi:hypothetical protein